MLLDLFGFFVAVGTFAAFGDWRRGLYFAVIAGILQDPVRKLTPGTPPILAIAALPIVTAALLGLFTHDRRTWLRFAHAHPHLARSLKLFALALLPGVAMLFVSYGLGAWPAALLGLFGYLTPLAAVVAGFSFVRDERDLGGLLRFYAAVAGTAMAGSLLDFLRTFEDWPALGTAVLGAPWLRFTRTGDVIRLVSGFFRSPDVMGWHAATLLMVAATLALAPRRPQARLWLAAAGWAAFSVLVCGRRKMMMMPVLWAAVVLVYYLRTRRVGGAVTVAVAGVVVAVALAFAGGEVAIGAEYYSYAATTVAAAPQRLQEGTFDAVWWTLVQSGVLGAGIGSASQGMQHLGVGVTAGWQESGASKLVAELGLPGLTAGLFAALHLVRAGFFALRRSATAASSHHLVLGLVAIAVANGASFLVSHQVYGDLLVMTLSAFFIGILLSAPRWCRVPAPGPGPRARAVPVPVGAA